MRNKKLFFAILATLVGSTSMAVNAQENPAVSDDPLCPMDSDSLCETYSSQESSLANRSFAYVGLSGMWNSIKSNFPTTKSTNNSPLNLGSPTILQGADNTPVANPQAGEGITLSTTASSLSQNGGGGALTFGYCANVTSCVYLGFYGGLGMTSLSKTIPITMVAEQYEVTAYSVDTTTKITTLTINPLEPSTESFQSTLKANLFFNAGLSLGFRFLDSVMLFVKCGWTGLRLTSSVQNELVQKMSNAPSTTTASQSASYNPKYVNGVSGSIGLDYFVTDRLSVGLEVFGTKYADKETSLFVYHMDPNPINNNPSQNTNQIGIVGTPVTTQTLTASPMSLDSWGVLLSVKVNFTEQ